MSDGFGCAHPSLHSFWPRLMAVNADRSHKKEDIPNLSSCRFDHEPTD
jgi:hypothetical protein